MAASVKSTWFVFTLKSHCVVIISISNDIMRIYWTLARVELSLLSYLSQKQFHCNVIRPVVGQQNYTNEKYPLYIIYGVFL